VSRRLRADVGWLWSGYVGRTVAYLGLIVVLTRALGPTAFGEFSLFLALTLGVSQIAGSLPFLAVPVLGARGRSIAAAFPTRAGRRVDRDVNDVGDRRSGRCRDQLGFAFVAVCAGDLIVCPRGPAGRLRRAAGRGSDAWDRWCPDAGARHWTDRPARRGRRGHSVRQVLGGRLGAGRPGHLRHRLHGVDSSRSLPCRRGSARRSPGPDRDGGRRRHGDRQRLRLRHRLGGDLRSRRLSPPW